MPDPPAPEHHSLPITLTMKTIDITMRYKEAPGCPPYPPNAGAKALAAGIHIPSAMLVSTNGPTTRKLVIPRFSSAFDSGARATNAANINIGTEKLRQQITALKLCPVRFLVAYRNV